MFSSFSVSYIAVATVASAVASAVGVCWGGRDISDGLDGRVLRDWDGVGSVRGVQTGTARRGRAKTNVVVVVGRDFLSVGLVVANHAAICCGLI